MIYKVDGLKFNYHLGDQKVTALHGIDFHMNSGGFVCLSGPSGSGKSTFLSLLGMIEPVQEGVLEFSGKNLKKLSEKEKNKIRKFDLGFIFQSFHLFQVLNAYENVEYFLQRQGVGTKRRKEVTEKMLKAVGLWDRRYNNVLKLSGGQRQRVAIARALAKSPKVIIADEPTASLDQKTGREIMDLLLKLNKDEGVSIIMASHDPMVIENSPKVIVLQDGKIAKALQ